VRQVLDQLSGRFAKHEHRFQRPPESGGDAHQRCERGCGGI
jgi:hypothetical protein